MRFVVLGIAGLALGGCIEKEAADPGDWVRAETVRATRPPSNSARTVRVGCDEEGGLHIRAPQGSQVSVPSDATRDAEAEIVLPDDAPPAPIRRTKSLGFIGDNKLTQTPSRGGPWNVPDGLLPLHRHVETRYDIVPGYGGYAGSARYVYGGRVVVVPPPSAGSPPSPMSAPAAGGPRQGMPSAPPMPIGPR